MTAPKEPRYWGEMTSTEIAEAQERGDVVLLPVGAVEQHGPHLPVDTDISGAWEAAREVGRRLDFTLLAPPVWWGLSDAHRGFPGLLTLRTTTLLALLTDLCNSIVEQGFDKIALVVGHGSNHPAIRGFVADFADRTGIRLLHINYLALGGEVFREQRKSSTGGEMHAGELETSLQMYFRPDRVDPETVRAAPIRIVDPKRDFGLSDAMADIANPGKVVVGFNLKESFPDGVLGDPTVATAELGANVFEAIVDKACAVLDEYREMPQPATAKRAGGA